MIIPTTIPQFVYHSYNLMINGWCYGILAKIPSNKKKSILKKKFVCSIVKYFVLTQINNR